MKIFARRFLAVAAALKLENQNRIIPRLNWIDYKVISLAVPLYCRSRRWPCHFGPPRSRSDGRTCTQCSASSTCFSETLGRPPTATISSPSGWSGCSCWAGPACWRRPPLRAGRGRGQRPPQGWGRGLPPRGRFRLPRRQAGRHWPRRPERRRPGWRRRRRCSGRRRRRGCSRRPWWCCWRRRGAWRRWRRRRRWGWRVTLQREEKRGRSSPPCRSSDV